MKIQIPESEKRKKAFNIVKTLINAGFEAYIVGGAVRDTLLKNNVSDFDITTSAKPAEIKKLFKKTVAVGESFGVVIVVSGDDMFEVATFRKDGLYIDGRHPETVEFSTAEEDVRRRDFTVNALLYSPSTSEVIDYTGGLKDLELRLIRAIGIPGKRFQEDKLRLLRAVRFAARLDFEIEEETYKSIVSMHKNISEVSSERIRDELTKMLTGENPVKALNLLKQSGLLKEVLPEVDILDQVMQDPRYHPEGDVLTHTFKLFEFIPENPPVELAWAALLHDIGKKPAAKIRNGKITFYNHETIGAKMAETIMKRLKFSADITENVVSLIRNHMRLLHVPEMKESTFKKLLALPFKGETKDKRKFFKYMSALTRLDLLASVGTLEIYEYAVKRAENTPEGTEAPARLITGKDLKRMGFSPGPLFKTILDDVFTKQLDGEIKTKEEAEQYVLSNYSLL